MRGFALMQHARDLEAAWLSSPFYSRNVNAIAKIRERVRLQNPAAYRGIGRFPFTEWPERGPGWESEFVASVDPEEAARKMLLDALGPDAFAVSEPRAFIANLDQAHAVRRATTNASAFEVVELCTGSDHCTQSLGFDVGYWGGGNFSILCDAAIWPRWHPPVENALKALAAFVASLNGCLLFPSTQVAVEYRGWYASQKWAEEEPEEFEVIEVGSLAAAAVG